MNIRNTVVAALIICMATFPAMAKDIQMDIKNYMFEPKDVTVHVGDKIIWTNRDQVPHTIAETDKLFRSAALDTGDSFSYTFTKPGSFHYFCTLHPMMTGTVTVTP